MHMRPQSRSTVALDKVGSVAWPSGLYLNTTADVDDMQWCVQQVLGALIAFNQSDAAARGELVLLNPSNATGASVRKHVNDSKCA